MTDRSRLRQFIIDYFSDEELTDLTFDYFSEVNRIYASGMTKGQKVRELIDFADRHGRGNADTGHQGVIDPDPQG